jgi:serralysin
MASTLFLQPTTPTSNPNPNFATARGNAAFFNYSQSASGVLASAEKQTLVTGGVATAIAGAEAIFSNDPTFSLLFTESGGQGEDGAFQVNSQSKTEIVASFSVAANQTFSFDFLTNIDLIAKEIENPKTEYSNAQTKTAFLVLEVSDVRRPRVIDYFGAFGQLISSQGVNNLRVGSSRSVTLSSNTKTVDIGGDNGTDAIAAETLGTYKRTFARETRIAIAEINTSNVKLLGDTFIGNLGADVRYGTIWNDILVGTNYADKIYGSLGDDTIRGSQGDDILEGGQGRDLLYGDRGDDRIHGGANEDLISGGLGRDLLVGGTERDTFIFQRNQSLLNGEYDIITDFEVGIDKIQMQGWGSINAEIWFNQAVDRGQLTNTQDGTLFTAISGGKVLFEGVSLDTLRGSDFVFM